MSVVSEIKEVGPCRKQLSIEVPGPAVEAETQRVVQTYRRHAKAPGFRKGKMPESMVRQRFREEIEKEVLDRLIPRYWKQAEAEQSLDPLLPPRVEEVHFEPDDKLSFIATVEIRPEIEVGRLDGFDLPEVETEPTAEEIEAATSRLQRDAGEWVIVERAAATGDLVEAQVRELGVEDDESGEDGQDVAFEVGHDQVWSELSEATTGLSADETAEFERPGEGEGAEARRFEVRVKAIKELEPAELDDELASRIAGLEGVDALKAEIEGSIRASKQADRRRQREVALLDELRVRHPMELPEGVIEAEIEGLLREYADGLAARGVDIEAADVDWQELAQKVRPRAEERIQSRLILDAVADDRSIEVDSEELERALADIARAQRTSTVALRQQMDQSGQLDGLRMQLRRQKTLAALLGDETEDEPDAGSGSPEGAESAKD
jgi:trigger factor